MSRSDRRPMGPFFVIWTGQAFSLLGSQLVQFALIWWLTRTSGRATVLALASMMGLLPQVFLGPFAGALVDRWNRRRVLVVADAGIAAATLILALLYRFDLAQVWHVYLLLFARATGAAFHWPAMQASTTLMVPREQLARVAGLNQTLGGLAAIFVPPLGALALELLPMQGVLAIDVVTALLAILPLAFVSIPQPPAPDRDRQGDGKRSLWSDMAEGLRFVTSWRGLLVFSAIGTLSNMLGGAAASLRPLLVTTHFGGGALELAWLQSAAGVGAVLGGLALGIWGGFRRRIVTVMLALALDGVAIALVGLTPSSALWMAVAAVFASGLLETVVMGTNGAIFQAIVPPEMQGRVFSLLISVAQIAAPLGLAIAGPLSDLVGVRIWWVLAGVIIGVMGAVAFRVPAVMRIEDGPEASLI